MDRAHRLGQKRTVNVYRLLTRDSLEDKIMGLQRFKLDVANSVVNQDNVSLKTMDAGRLLDLFTLEKNDKAAGIPLPSLTPHPLLPPPFQCPLPFLLHTVLLLTARSLCCAFCQYWCWLLVPIKLAHAAPTIGNNPNLPACHQLMQCNAQVSCAYPGEVSAALPAEQWLGVVCTKIWQAGTADSIATSCI